jgi:hypothetical protein
MTKAEYGAIPADLRGTRVSLCGRFRFKITKDLKAEGPYYSKPWVAVFLTDSKAHPAPEPIENGEAA